MITISEENLRKVFTVVTAYFQTTEETKDNLVDILVKLAKVFSKPDCIGKEIVELDSTADMDMADKIGRHYGC